MIFSVGHGAVKTVDELEGLLRLHKVSLLIDIRSKPYSRWQSAFNKGALGALMGNRYAWMGDILGGLGPPIEKPALDQLVELAREQRVAIMCSEGHPSKCHRQSVIGVRLLERGIEVAHILKNGTILTSKAARELDE